MLVSNNAGATATASVRQVPVAPEVRALSTLARVDYADTFLAAIDPATDRTPKQLARAMLEDASARTRMSLLSGWTSIGLKLSPGRSSGYVLGWQLRRSTPQHVLLGAESRIGLRGELLFARERPDTLLFATFVELDNPLARAVWAGTEPAHVPIVRRLLEQGSRRVAA